MRCLARGFAVAALLMSAGAANAQETQTIRPGMTEQEVMNAFGNPDNRSSRGEFTYYFYENQCQQECGMADLVIFQNSQVIDAILRAAWRNYAGESSSPRGVLPQPTPMRLLLPQAQDQNQLRIEVRPVGQPEPQPADTAASDSTSSGG